MADDIAALVAAIESFVVPANEDETETTLRLNDVLSGARGHPERAVLAEPLFRLLERYADRDLGAPGPVVHALETIADYSLPLRESLHRQPTYYTVWMVNRILNTELSAADRAMWLSELRGAARHAKSNAAVADSVARFLKHQGESLDE
jgi:hypothetical protein